MFQEFPKALYMGGDPAGASAVVADSEQEAAKRAEGFCMVGEQSKRDERDDEPTAESLRAQLDAAGIAYDKRWGVKKLQELLPKE